jgi:hypothetical protein
MKKRTLLLGPCGGCPNRDQQVAAAKMLGNAINAVNARVGPNASQAAKDQWAKAFMDAARLSGNHYVSNADTYNEMVAQYNKIKARCGLTGWK